MLGFRLGRLEMAGVGGITEAQVMARWGAPQSVAGTSGVRHLTYNFSETQYGVNAVTVDLIYARGEVVGQTSQNQLTSRARNCRRMLSLDTRWSYRASLPRF